MAESAVARVFRLPELLTLIIDFVCDKDGTSLDLEDRDSYDSVAPLARVARNWADPVITKRWETQNTLKRLHSLPADRQEYYARKIRKLSLERPHELDTHLPHLHCSLRRVELLELGTQSRWRLDPDETTVRTPAAQWAREVLGPQTRTLSVEVPQLSADPDLLRAISSLCPHLEKIYTAFGDQEQLPSGLATVIRSTKHRLKQFECSSPSLSTSENIEPLLIALGEADNLELIQVMEGLSFALFEKWVIDHAASGPTEMPISFPRLKRMFAWVRLSILPYLPNILPESMYYIRLMVESNPDPGTEGLPSLQTMRVRASHGLKHLSLCIMDEDCTFDQKTWLSLTGFPALYTLRIQVDGGDEYRKDGELLRAFELTDDTVAKIFESLPLLQDLRLDIHHQLTLQALVALGMNCRQLARFQIPGSFHWNQLFNQGLTKPPLFPELLVFLTGSMNFGMSPPPGDYDPAVALAKRHLPNRPRFVFVDDELQAAALNKVFEEEWEEDDKIGMAGAEDTRGGLDS